MFNKLEAKTSFIESLFLNTERSGLDKVVLDLITYNKEYWRNNHNLPSNIIGSFLEKV